MRGGMGAMGSLLLATLAATQVAAQSKSYAAGERAVLQWADAEQAAGRIDHAARGVLRAAKQAPSDALLLRYAELALPCEVPNERAREKVERAAGKLLEIVDKASKREPPLDVSPALGVYAAWALAITGDFTQGREVAARFGARDDAQTVRCLRASAQLALAKGDATGAEGALGLARGFSPTDPALASQLGLMLLAQGQAQRALVPLAERFAVEPSSLSARRDFAYALLAVGRAPEGYALLDVAREACIAVDVCLLELARSALEARRPAEAEQHARTLLGRDDKSLDALFLLAESQLQRGDTRAARTSYQRILAIAPGNLRAEAALAGLPGETR